MVIEAVAENLPGDDAEVLIAASARSVPPMRGWLVVAALILAWVIFGTALAAKADRQGTEFSPDGYGRATLVLFLVAQFAIIVGAAWLGWL